MNERKAGRKRQFDNATIKKITDSYQNGRSVSELAAEYGVSRQTVSFYVHEIAAEIEIRSTDEDRSIVRSFSYWRRLNRMFKLKDAELGNFLQRMDYMLDDAVLTTILVDWKHEKILSYNHVEHPMKCAFGIKKNPTWEDFMYFLEDRCMPRSRDHMKIVLQDLNLDFYDPLLIVRKTGGRMAEDRRHLRIYDLEADHEAV